MKTFAPKKQDIKREWFVVDAAGQTLGRLSTRVATMLRGKHKPTYAPHMDMGDYVVVINAEKIKVTGLKATQKTYWRHSGYLGSLKQEQFEKLLARKPEEIIKHAVLGMIGHTKLSQEIGKKLKVYKGSEHPHGGQEPKELRV